MNKQEKKYKNGHGISLNLEEKNDSLSILLKEVVKEAVKLIDKKEYNKAKEFLTLNFDT